MNQNKNLKHIIIKKLLEIVDKKIYSAQNAIDSAKEARNSETKSSVGDKYETGRAMMQFEIEKHTVQLQKAQQQKHELSQIDLKKEYKQIEFGSLVFTNKGNYFISIGIGKIENENQIFYCISMASPVGKQLHNKKPGEKIILQANEITISKIL